MIPLWAESFSTSLETDSAVTIWSESPRTINPEEGQGAKNVKSYEFAGGATEMKLVISGRRISNCIPIHDPKENPATQQNEALGLYICSQSKAEAASLSSPSP